FAYARQYVRHLRNLQDRNQHVMGMVAVAMEKEGLADGEGWTANPRFAHIREEIKSADASPHLAPDLDPEARALVERAALTEGLDISPRGAASPAPSPRPSLSLEEQRVRIRQALARKVPRDPKGKVDIQFFFRPQDKASILMASEIEKLSAKASKNGEVNVIGLTLEMEHPARLSTFRKKTGATFPIRYGGKLAES